MNRLAIPSFFREEHFLFTSQVIIWSVLYFFTEPSPLLHFGLLPCASFVIFTAYRREIERFHTVFTLYVLAASLWYISSALPFIITSLLSIVGSWGILSLSPARPHPTWRLKIAYAVFFTVCWLLGSRLPFGFPLQAALISLCTASLLEAPSYQTSFHNWKLVRQYAILILVASLVLAFTLYFTL